LESSSGFIFYRTTNEHLLKWLIEIFTKENPTPNDNIDITLKIIEIITHFTKVL
jgi:hypothetical protein